MNKTIISLIILLILIIILTLINLKDLRDYDIYYNDLKYFVKSYWKKNYLLNNNMLYKPLNKNNKIAIITFDNRKNTKYIELHNKNITEYCKKWNYEYIFYDKCVHNVYWCKLYFVLDALKTQKYDYVMWMDSDTIIKNPNISLDSIINKYSSDIYVNLDNGSAVYCSGVFIIKNSPMGISYLEDCIKSNNKKCTTKNNKLKGFWAGLCYEQGIMNELIFQKYYKYTTCLPEYLVLNDYINETNDICNEDTFILHIYGSPDKLREKCFLNYV